MRDRDFSGGRSRRGFRALPGGLIRTGDLTMPRKTLDIDPELDALKARIEKRLTSHKLALGEIVWDCPGLVDTADAFA